MGRRGARGHDSGPSSLGAPGAQSPESLSSEAAWVLTHPTTGRSEKRQGLEGLALRLHHATRSHWQPSSRPRQGTPPCVSGWSRCGAIRLPPAPPPPRSRWAAGPWGAQLARCRGSGARLLVRQPPNSGARFPGTMPRLVFHHRPAEASLLLSPEPGPDVPRPDSLVPDTSPQPVSS